MLELLAMTALVLCLSRFLTCVGLVGGNSVYWVTICIGVAISIAYGGDNIKNAVLLGAASGMCVNAIYAIERTRT